MPDLTTEHRYICSNTQEYSREFKSGSNPNKSYTASLSKLNPGQYQFNWSCDCWSFRKKHTCSHVKKAESELCDKDGYRDYYDKKPPSGKCSCGGKLIVCAFGV